MSLGWSWFQYVLTDAPIPFIAVILLAAMIGAGLLTGWVRRRPAANPPSEEDREGQEGYVVSAVLGLLALLLGFTFSLAVDRFEGRRALVLAEANAIGTAYLRVQLLPEPHRARMSALLVDYVDNRIALAKAPRGRGTALLARNDALVTDIWVETVAVFPAIRSYDFSSPFIESMNLVIDLDTSRKAARLARVPPPVFGMLFVYAVAAAGVLGYVLKSARSRRSAASLLVLLSMALLLIIDIDRPGGGRIVESQLPMELLQTSLKNWSPQVFDAQPAVP